MDLAEAKILHERGQIDDAIAAYSTLLTANFDAIDVLFYYGTALFQKGNYGIAATALKRVIEIRPTMQSAYQNLGNCFKAIQDYEGARAIYQMGLDLGDESQLFCCMGSLNINMGSPKEALKWYEKGLALDTGNDVIRFNMGLAYLEMGVWKKGFDYYDRGFNGSRSMRQYGNLPVWDGTPGKKVIVWGEQGIGDEIMFASILPDMMKISEKVIFDCHPRLVDTMRRSFGIECHGTRKNHHLEWLPKSDAECHICITTLAKYFRKQTKDFPGIPYLKPEITRKLPGSYPEVTPANVPFAPVKLPFTPAKLRVGISWEGGTPYTRSDLRSIPLIDMLPILEMDCDFYSLQYTPNAARDIDTFEERTGIHLKHYPGKVETYNYDKTINFIAGLDLVITVCTSAYHVAGALGVPVWCLTPSGPAWRYGVEGDTSPWYGSARLFRQGKGQPWAEVIERVACELDKKLVEHESKTEAETHT